MYALIAIQHGKTLPATNRIHAWKLYTCTYLDDPNPHVSHRSNHLNFLLSPGCRNSWLKDKVLGGFNKTEVAYLPTSKSSG